MRPVSVDPVRRERGGEATERPAVYLDYQATTPVDHRVVAAMLPFFTEAYGNPHSRSHAYGREAERAVEEARVRVASVIGARSREIVFTSGATESNNLAIKGAAEFRRGDRDHIVTCVTEHKCVLESCRALEGKGFSVSYLPVGASGLVDLDHLAASITDRTCLVSIMAVNNEIGVIQPLAAIGALCHTRGALLHTDAAQAVGKIALDVDSLGIDLMSLSAHKVYGPKGIGALYVRRRPRTRLVAQMSGGGQERGLRSGTLPTPLCVGLGAACSLAETERPDESARLLRLRQRLLAAIAEAVPDAVLNGDPVARLPGNLNIAFPGVNAEALMESMPDVAISSGSACTSTAVEASYVLRALGLDTALAAGSVRIGLGRFTTEAEVEFAAQRIIATVTEQRRGNIGDETPAAGTM